MYPADGEIRWSARDNFGARGLLIAALHPVRAVGSYDTHLLREITVFSS